MTTTETAPTFHHFVVYAPDKTEAGTFEKRLAVRSKHLENVQVLIGNGTISECITRAILGVWVIDDPFPCRGGRRDVDS
jgi:hypothetical protein